MASDWPCATCGILPLLQVLPPTEEQNPSVTQKLHTRELYVLKMPHNKFL